MTMVNYASREINCKVVYYGPGMGGKTTTLEQVYGKVSPEQRGKMVSLATETERTLFFDFLPVDFGAVRGFKVRFHLYTVPGQVYYNASRKLILKGVDGVVFVADSRASRAEANIESMQNLYDNMYEYGYDLATIPLVMQYNKRDLPDASPVEELQRQLNPGWCLDDDELSAEPTDRGRAEDRLVERVDGTTWIARAPFVETVAISGEGVLESLRQVSKMVLKTLS